MIRALFSQALAALPTQCAVCRAWQSDVMCAGCRRDHRPFTSTPPNVDDFPVDVPWAAAVPYAFPWDGFVSEFKFGDRPAWAKHCAAWMLQSSEICAVLENADALVPMPLSRHRLRARGYNQASLLAQALRQAWSRTRSRRMPVIDGVLLRTRDTAHQAGLTRAERLTNLHGALQVDPLQSGLLAGQHLAVVDDVMTSGASLKAAADVLTAARAKSVSGVVFARA